MLLDLRRGGCTVCVAVGHVVNVVRVCGAHAIYLHLDGPLCEFQMQELDWCRVSPLRFLLRTMSEHQ